MSYVVMYILLAQLFVVYYRLKARPKPRDFRLRLRPARDDWLD